MAKFKQACFAHDLSKKFQIFAAVHKSNVLNSAAKLILSNLSPNLSAYDSKIIKEIPYESESYYVFDHGYKVFKELFKIQTTMKIRFFRI